VLCSIAHAQSRKENLWLKFHTELLYATCKELQLLAMTHRAELQLHAMHHSVEFFCTARSQNTNVSSLVTAVKATVWQKKTIGDLGYPMTVK
jgi:hypothetical protein